MVDEHLIEEACVIIPAYNEAGYVGIAVGELRKYFKSVIVVNDHSTDETAELARAAAAIVVDSSSNLGYDGAIGLGFKRAEQMGFKYAITSDADGQIQAEDVLRVGRLLTVEGYSLVVGIRPGFQRFSERLMSWYSRGAFGLRDPLSGLKGYDMSLYREAGYFDSFGSIGTELAHRAMKRGARFIQFQISMEPRVFGKPSFGGAWRANWKILRALLKTIIMNSTGKL